MSSHHIIRDNQEPALVLVEPLPWDQLSSLLEWSPTIFVRADLLDWIESLGIKVDFIFGNNSEKSRAIEQLAYQQPITFLELNYLDWPLLIPQIKNDTIHISKSWEFVQIPEEKTIIFFGTNEKTYLIKDSWQKWLNKNESIRIIHGEVQHTENLQTDDGINYKVMDHGPCKIEPHNEIWLSEVIS